MTVLSSGSSQAALQVIFDRRKNESITAEFKLIVSRSSNLSLVREGKQSWLGTGGAANAARLGGKKEEEGGVRERIYAQAEEGGSVVLAPEYPGDIVILTMQEAIRMPLAPPALSSSSFASYLPSLRSSSGSSSSASFGGYNIMPGTQVLAREGSITSHTIRDPHLIKTMGLVGLRLYRGAGKLALASSFGHIVRRELGRGEECLIKKGHLLGWSESVNVLRYTRKGTNTDNTVKAFVLQGPGEVYVKSHSVGDFHAWISHPASKPQNPSVMQAQIVAEGGPLNRGDKVIKYLGLAMAAISGLVAATTMATVLQEGPAGVRKLPERFRQTAQDAFVGLQDFSVQAKGFLRQQGAVAQEKTGATAHRLRAALIRLLKSLLARVREVFMSLSFLGEETKDRVEKEIDRLMTTWHHLEEKASTAVADMRDAASEVLLSSSPQPPTAEEEEVAAVPVDLPLADELPAASEAPEASTTPPSPSPPIITEPPPSTIPLPPPPPPQPKPKAARRKQEETHLLIDDGRPHAHPPRHQRPPPVSSSSEAMEGKKEQEGMGGEGGEEEPSTSP